MRGQGNINMRGKLYLVLRCKCCTLSNRKKIDALKRNKIKCMT